jgi:hypothetical protein
MRTSELVPVDGEMAGRVKVRKEIVELPASFKNQWKLKGLLCHEEFFKPWVIAVVRFR